MRFFLTRRYFKYELLAKGAITKENLSIFLSTWLDKSNSTCMFSANQPRTWSTSHLTGGGWYLDCAPSFTPSFETELRKSWDAVGEFGVEMVDLQGIEDEHERAKALSRRLEEDRKKALKVKEAEEKAAQKEMAKLHNSLEKTNKRGKKKMNPLQSHNVRAHLRLVLHMTLVLMLQFSLEEPNAIPPMSS